MFTLGGFTLAGSGLKGLFLGSDLSDDNGFFGIDFGGDTVRKLDVIDANAVVDVDVGDVDFDVRRNVGWRRRNGERVENVFEDAAGLAKLVCFTNQGKRDFNGHHFVAADHLKVNVGNGVADGVKLHAARQGEVLLALNVKVDQRIETRVCVESKALRL